MRGYGYRITVCRDICGWKVASHDHAKLLPCLPTPQRTDMHILLCKVKGNIVGKLWRQVGRREGLGSPRRMSEFIIPRMLSFSYEPQSLRCFKRPPQSVSGPSCRSCATALLCMRCQSRRQARQKQSIGYLFYTVCPVIGDAHTSSS